MPVSIAKADGFRVSTPHGVKAKHATKKNALAQERLLNAVEHGWKPTGQPAVVSHHSTSEEGKRQKDEFYKKRKKK